MRTVLLSSLRHHTRRYVASALAVVIGVAFVVATGMLTGAMREGLSADVGAPVAGLDQIVSSPNDNQIDALLTAAREGDVPAITIAHSWESVSNDGVRITQPVDVAEVATDPRVQWQRLETGRFPRTSDEAVVDVNAAKGNGVEIGDVLQIGSGGRAREVTVVGTVDSPAGFAKSLYVPWETLRHFDGSLWVEAIAWGGSAALATDVAPGISVEPAADWLAEQQAEISRGVDVMAMMALLFIAIAFFVAVLVIANTFSILFAQRMREFALLRCVGVTRRQLRRSVRVEALAMGVAASTLGIVAGSLGGLGLVAIIRHWFSDMGAATLEPLWMGGAFAVGVLVTVAAAWLPTRSVTRVAPLAALRPDTGPDVRSASGRTRLSLAVLFGAAGAGLLVASVSSGSVPVLLAGGMIFFLAVLLFGPWLIPALVRAAGSLIGSGPVRSLATGNAVRNPRRTATTAASLLVGVTLTTAVLTGLASARTGLDQEMDDSHPLDVTLTAVSAPLDAGLVQRVAAVDGVEETLTLDGAITSVAGDPLTLAAVGSRPTVVRGPRDLTPADGVALLSYEAAQALPDALYEQLLDAHTLTVQVAGRDHVLEVELGGGFGQVGLVSPNTLADLTPDPRPVALWVRATAGADPEDLDGDLAALAGTAATLDGGYADRVSIDRQVTILTGAVVGLLAIAVLIALIGIGNTLGLSVLERGRENALLRAMGLTRQQLRRALAAEGLLLSLVATLLGTSLGLVFAWVGVRVLVEPVMADASLDIPVLQLATVVAVAATAGLAACVLPARRAAQITPAAGLALS